MLQMLLGVWAWAWAPSDIRIFLHETQREQQTFRFRSGPPDASFFLRCHGAPPEWTLDTRQAVHPSLRCVLWSWSPCLGLSILMQGCAFLE